MGVPAWLLAVLELASASAAGDAWGNRLLFFVGGVCFRRLV